MDHFSHIPVLLEETITGLNISQGKKYIDATLGGGGHAQEILKRGGKVLGIDQDTDALEHVAKKYKEQIATHNLRIVKGNFRDIVRIAKQNGFDLVDGILFDLGVSSHQLNSVERGFSLKSDARLDMRMDKDNHISAFEVVNNYSRDRLVEIFYKYGEEHNAKKIAEEIVSNRKKTEITTTMDLIHIIERVPHKSEAIHPATRAFQAIRIEVNSEIDAMKAGISDSFELLNTDGRLAVISFHSLEDRFVKQLFAKFEKSHEGKILTKKPITASEPELAQNRRARSAKLRIIERI